MKTQKSMITLLCVFMMILICSCFPADPLNEVGIATDNGLENLAASNAPTMSPEATAQPGLTITVSQTVIVIETTVTPTVISVVTKSGMN